MAGRCRTRYRHHFSEKKSFTPVCSARTRSSNESSAAQSQDAEPAASANTRDGPFLLFNLAGRVRLSLNVRRKTR